MVVITDFTVIMFEFSGVRIVRTSCDWSAENLPRSTGSKGINTTNVANTVL